MNPSLMHAIAIAVYGGANWSLGYGSLEECLCNLVILLIDLSQVPKAMPICFPGAEAFCRLAQGTSKLCVRKGGWIASTTALATSS